MEVGCESLNVAIFPPYIFNVAVYQSDPGLQNRSSKNWLQSTKMASRNRHKVIVDTSFSRAPEEKYSSKQISSCHFTRRTNLTLLQWTPSRLMHYRPLPFSARATEVKVPRRFSPVAEDLHYERAGLLLMQPMSAMALQDFILDVVRRRAYRQWRRISPKMAIECVCQT